LGGNEEKTYVVHNAVDTEKFKPPEKGDLEENIFYKNLNLEGKTVILNTRSLRPVYGHKYLIEAASIISKGYKDVQFIIAGNGPLRRYLEELVRKRDLRDNVKFIGSVPKSLMPQLYKVGHIFVNTSLSEGLPLSILESMASEVPVISFNVGGVPEAIDDGIEGFLVPPKDYKKLAEKIEYLLDNPTERRLMGNRARKKVESEFNIDKKTEMIIKIYESFLS